MAAALLLVAQSAAATQASYQIASLKQQQTHLSAEHDQLAAQLASEQAATQVAAAAQQLGLSHPSRWQWIKAADSPIALGPIPATASHTTMLDHVLSVVAAITGRPLTIKVTH